MSGPSRATRLRRLLSRQCVPMPGAFNAAIARLIERAGFGACYISGAGLANATAGMPDIGLLGLDEVARLASYICSAVKIPVLADADTGFGDDANVARTVREFERAGLAGLHLEDQDYPKRCGHLAGKQLVSIDQMVRKIRVAARARRDKDFLIIARTDARTVEGYQAAVQRALLYRQAGADMIFPEALESAAEFRSFASAVSAPLLANMTEFGRSPLLSVKQLSSMGYRAVIFPQTAFRVTMKSAGQCLGDLSRRGTQRSWLARMQTRQELYDLLNYDPADNVPWTP